MPELPFDPPNAAPLRPPVAERPTHHYGQKDILVMYPALRLDHLRYLEKCGLIKPAFKSGADTFFSFSDLTTLRQLAGELRQGAVWRAAVRHPQARLRSRGHLVRATARSRRSGLRPRRRTP